MVINNGKEIIDALEESLAAFAESGYSDVDIKNSIMLKLSDAPLYFPIEVNMDAMFGNTDPAKLQKGDIIQSAEEVSMSILTLTLNDETEVVPAFTSNEELRKGPDCSVIRYHPIDYLPRVLRMNMPVLINPFSEKRFILVQKNMIELLLPKDRK